MKIDTIITLWLILITINSNAQNFRKTILAFDIIEANINGKDDSELHVINKTFITFYRNTKDSILNLAIVWPNNSSMSYGPLTVSNIRTNNELYEGKTTEKSYYKWYYKNTYDNNQGWANIELSIVYETYQAFYILRMFVDKDFQINTYKGFLNEKLTDTITEIK